MPIPPAHARSLFDALRYLWRGTRWRPGRERTVPAEVAGYLVNAEGVQRSIGEFGTSLADAANRAPLTEAELLVLSEFFGLNGYPAGLSTGRDALVGGVAAPSSRRSPTPARRSTVIAVLDAAVAKVAVVLETRAHPTVVTMQPESDPSTRAWVLAPPVLDRLLSPRELHALLESAFYAAFDLIDRSEHFPELDVALHRWARGHLGAGPVAVASRPSSPEQRNAVNAVLAVTLWDITHSELQLVQALASDPIVGWVGVERASTGGRIAVHPKYGPMTSNLGADELVLLVDEVMEGRDPLGRAADVVVDALFGGRVHELLDADESETVIWALGRGLAASGSWRSVELARWYAEHERLSPTTVSLVSWSAHVASIHRHDSLAWRLCALAERLTGRLAQRRGATRAQLARMAWQIELIRAGCRVREADRWCADSPRKAGRALLEAMQRLRLVEAAARELTQATGGVSRAITHDLRLIEILLVASRLRVAGWPIEGFIREHMTATRLGRQLGAALLQGGPGLDEDELGTLQRRLDLLNAALEADAIETTELDDSPSGP